MSNAPLYYARPAVPPEIDRWNWGAFLLSWIWGIGNRTFIAFLVFVPFFGILVMPFVLGARGSAWAWQNRPWASVDEFRRVQRLWAIWGVVAWVAVIVASVVFAVGLWLLLTYILSTSDAYRLGVDRLRADQRVVAQLGEPITAGWPSGSISVENASGHASLSFLVGGPKADGVVALEANKAGGRWILRGLRLTPEGAAPIDLLDDRPL